MNRHSKIILILLLIILISLGTAIVMFHINVGKDVRSSDKNILVSDMTEKYFSVDIFKDKNGLFGLKDSGGTIILEPEWTELEPFGTDFFRAKLMARAGSPYGIIDTNGNIIVPFVYSDIKKLSDYIYVASLKNTEEYLFYNKNFDLLLPTTADNYYFIDTNLCIVKGEDEFVYKQGDELSLIKAEIPRFKRPIDLSLTIEDPFILLTMSNSQLSDFGDKTVIFLDMLRRNKTDKVSEIIDSSSIVDINSVLKTELGWKGKLSENIYVYASVQENESDVVIYLETELIIPNEEETDTENMPITLEFKKNEEGQWLIFEVSLG